MCFTPSQNHVTKCWMLSTYAITFDPFLHFRSTLDQDQVVAPRPSQTCKLKDRVQDPAVMRIPDLIPVNHQMLRQVVVVVIHRALIRRTNQRPNQCWPWLHRWEILPKSWLIQSEYGNVCISPLAEEALWHHGEF